MEVNRELRVPFALDSIHCEMWLREENPSEAELEIMIETQPESARPALRRLIDEAKGNIEGYEPASSAVDEPVDEDDEGAEGYDDMTQAQLHDLLAERGLPVSGTKAEQIARLEADDDPPVTDPEDLPTVEDDGAAAEASADALDAVLEDDE